MNIVREAGSAYAKWMKKLLAHAGVYSLFSLVIGRKWGRLAFVNDFIRPRCGDRILDIGCGTADILDSLPQVNYFGFDLSEDYIAAARRRYGNRGEFGVARVDAQLIDQYQGFDLVLALGVLHHLADHEAIDLFKIARSALKPGGRLITFDGCYTEGQSAIARYLLGHDRGEYVRSEPEYRRLAETSFSTVTSRVRNDLLRVPYTHVILECANPTTDRSESSHVDS